MQIIYNYIYMIYFPLNDTITIDTYHTVYLLIGISLQGQGVPLLVLQAASLEGGRMTLGDRESLDLRSATGVKAEGERGDDP